MLEDTNELNPVCLARATPGRHRKPSLPGGSTRSGLMRNQWTIPHRVHASVVADLFAQSRFRKDIPAVLSWAEPSANSALPQCEHDTALPCAVYGPGPKAPDAALTPRLSDCRNPLTPVSRVKGLIFWRNTVLHIRKQIKRVPISPEVPDKVPPPTAMSALFRGAAGVVSSPHHTSPHSDKALSPSAASGWPPAPSFTRANNAASSATISGFSLYRFDLSEMSSPRW